MRARSACVDYIDGNGGPARSVRLGARRAAKVVLVTAIVFMTTGCYSTFKMKEMPPKAAVLMPATENVALPAYFVNLSAVLDDVPSNPNPAFEERVLGRLHETNCFSDVLSVTARSRFQSEHALAPIEGSHYKISLHANERPLRHRFTNGVKGFFVVISLGLLMPALPHHYEHEAMLEMTVRVPDGKERTYTASGKGSSYYTTDVEHLRKGTEGTQAKTLEFCIISVMNQMASDLSPSK